MNEREKIFCLTYLRDFNATKAAIAAGYKPTRSRQTGCEMLKRPAVKAQIQKAMDRRAEKVGIEAEEVLRSIERVAKAAEQDDRYSEALKGYELLGKHLKLFTEKVEHTGAVALAIINEFREFPEEFE